MLGTIYYNLKETIGNVILYAPFIKTGLKTEDRVFFKYNDNKLATTYNFNEAVLCESASDCNKTFDLFKNKIGELNEKQLNKLITVKEKAQEEGLMKRYYKQTQNAIDQILNILK